MYVIPADNLVARTEPATKVRMNIIDPRIDYRDRYIFAGYKLIIRIFHLPHFSGIHQGDTVLQCDANLSVWIDCFHMR